MRPATIPGDPSGLMIRARCVTCAAVFEERAELPPPPDIFGGSSTSVRIGLPSFDGRGLEDPADIQARVNAMAAACRHGIAATQAPGGA